MMFPRPNLKLALIPIFSVLTGFSAFATGENSEEDKEKSKMNTTATMQLEVLDEDGKVNYLDVVTTEDANLDFDLQSMPLGNYTVLVSLGEEVINSVQIHNFSNQENTMHVEVLDGEGKQVYLSKDAHQMFDLELFPKGNYTVNVYQGSKLINTHKMQN